MQNMNMNYVNAPRYLQILMLYDVCHGNIVFMVKVVLNQVHTSVKWQN